LLLISVDGMLVVAQSYNDPVLRESNILNLDSTRDISQVTLHKAFGRSAALLYHRRVHSRWQAGLRVEIPLNINRNDSLTARVKTPVQLQLMFRYKLLRHRF